MSPNLLINPLRAFRWRYLPLLTIYFAQGFIVFSQVAELFWIKNSLSLSVTEIVAISVWINFPWSMKIIFGQFLDSFRIAGSARHAYVLVAACIMLIGNIITIGVAHKFPQITALGSTFHLLIISGFLIQLGVVIQDLIADTMCYDLAEKKDLNGNPRHPDDIRKEISNIQILVRITDISAAIIALGIGGLIATKFSYATISIFTLGVTLFSIVGTLLIRKEPEIEKAPIKMPFLVGGLLYVTVMILFGISSFFYKQEAIFLVGMTLVGSGLYYVCRDLDPQRKKEIFCLILVMFSFRAIPEFGPGVEWWQIDVLHFSPEFFSVLKQISLIFGLLGIIFLGKLFVKHNIVLMIFWINIIQCILHFPMIAMAYGLHEWTMTNWGFGAQTIALIDTSAEGPFYRFGFLLLCTIATYYAPKKHVATWFALFMSLMSLAYVSGGRLLKKYLSNIYVIERGNYENVADLMVTTTVIQFLLPTVVILIFFNPFKRNVIAGPSTLKGINTQT